MRGASELLANLEILPHVVNLVIPAPIRCRADFALVHLDARSIPRFFPSLKCLALTFDMGFCGPDLLKSNASALRADYPQLFRQCWDLGCIIELPANRFSIKKSLFDNLDPAAALSFGDSDPSADWPTKLQQMQSYGRPNCASWCSPTERHLHQCPSIELDEYVRAHYETSLWPSGSRHA
eukprot:TRINITY_DN108359_c0_g1_i1.p1 TRINITY_DN108359_c0_g1~~TRINITY_DN108359_c0_g1_i1.p1  ORF type:complete len:206 (-),score=23.35 TRINITY_DN108359_c0_g1_i1:137-676(-)